MTPQQKYKYWEMLSDYDIETAGVLMEGKRWLYVAFTCEQAVERLLKGMHVYHTGNEVPKTKNISFIFNRLTKCENFRKWVNPITFENEKDFYQEILIDLMYYHISDYPFSYTKVMDRFISEQTAKEVYQITKNVLKWLKSFQQEDIQMNA